MRPEHREGDDGKVDRCRRGEETREQAERDADAAAEFEDR
jgi:hypothetical protein